MNSERVLILDGETRSALAVTRSLGNAGYTCIVASHLLPSLAGSSKYCSGTLKCPSIALHPAEFTTWLKAIISTIKFDHILPLTDSSLTILFEDIQSLPDTVNFPFPDQTSVKATHDKFGIMELAKSHGLKTPLTILIPKDFEPNNHYANELISKLTLPVVFKARFSIQLTKENTLIKPPLVYAKTLAEVDSFLSSDLPKKFEYIAQEYIEGTGSGLFFLFRDKFVVAYFAHTRLLEKPPEGGVSVFSQSIEVDISLKQKCESLLKSLNWNGVAMLEFKNSNSGQKFLMEINPRFWGSLQLAVDSGVDFPKLLLSKTIPSSIPITSITNQRLKWELGLLDHCLIQLKRKPLSFIYSVIFKNSLGLFKTNTRSEIFRKTDRRPFYHEIFFYFKNLLK